MKTWTRLGAALAVLAPLSAAHADLTFLATDGNTLRRTGLTGAIETFSLEDRVTSLGVVPGYGGGSGGGDDGGIDEGGIGGPGFTSGVFQPGDIMATTSVNRSGTYNVYRLDGALSSAPTLTQVGTTTQRILSPVFVGDRLYGVDSSPETGGVVTVFEFDPVTFGVIDSRTTGVLGNTGGLAWDAGTNRFVFTNNGQNRLYAWSWDTGIAEAYDQGAGLDFQANGLESYGGEIYGAFTDHDSDHDVVGRFDDLGVFHQLRDLGISGNGTVGFAVIPAPGALALLGLAGLRGRRRRS